MHYVLANYATNPAAPVEKWACAPSSGREPFAETPAGTDTKGTKLCGRYVTPPSPKAVGPKTLRWGAHSGCNSLDKSYVVD